MSRRDSVVKRKYRRRGHGLDRERAGNAEAVLVQSRLVVERFLIGVISDGLVHAALHGLASFVERLKRSFGGLGPVVGEVKGHLPFFQHVAIAEGELLALAIALVELNRQRGGEFKRGVQIVQRRHYLFAVHVSLLKPALQPRWSQPDYPKHHWETRLPISRLYPAGHRCHH